MRPPEMISLPEWARRRGVGRASAYRWFEAGQLPGAVVNPDSGQIHIPSTAKRDLGGTARNKDAPSRRGRRPKRPANAEIARECAGKCVENIHPECLIRALDGEHVAELLRAAGYELRRARPDKSD